VKFVMLISKTRPAGPDADAGRVTFTASITCRRLYMQYRQRKALEALRSVQAYLDNHTDRLGDVNAGGARTTLNSVGKAGERGNRTLQVPRRALSGKAENAEIEQAMQLIACHASGAQTEFENHACCTPVDLTTLVHGLRWRRQRGRTPPPGHKRPALDLPRRWKRRRRRYGKWSTRGRPCVTTSWRDQ
jgi:hypothetical protein